MIHIGKKIERVIREQGCSVTWFAGQLGFTRVTAYNIFHRPDIDTDLLFRISALLRYNFFENFSEDFQKSISDDSLLFADNILSELDNV
jgi:hypothetical protein